MKNKTQKKLEQLKNEGYNVTIHHRFVGGKGHQNLTEPVAAILPRSGRVLVATGICEVFVTKDNQSGHGAAVAIDPYRRELGINIALGRALKNLGKEEPEYVPEVILLVGPEDYERWEWVDWDNGEN